MCVFFFNLVSSTLILLLYVKVAYGFTHKVNTLLKNEPVEVN